MKPSQEHKSEVIKPFNDKSVDPAEQQKFSQFAQSWWDPNGPMKPLHQLNPVRLDYIKQQYQRHLVLEKKSDDPFTPLQGLQLLDVGCGAGLVSEGLSRMGAAVSAIDATEKMIEAAKHHLQASPAPLTINYRHATVSQLVEEGKSFDAITALEVIEHVDDPSGFLVDLAKLVRPGGMLILSTLNKTARSYLLGIIAAEYVLRLLPRGTHEWQRFVKPAQMVASLQAEGFEAVDLTGIRYNPFAGSFTLTPHDVAVNYIISFKKQP